MELKFHGLHVIFGKPSESSQPTAKAIAATQSKIQNLVLSKDEAALKEERLAQMLIENPMEAEKLLMDGALDEVIDGEEA